MTQSLNKPETLRNTLNSNSHILLSIIMDFCGYFGQLAADAVISSNDPVKNLLMWGKHSFFFNLNYLSILLHNTVLVLPSIDLNPPWVYMCSPS